MWYNIRNQEINVREHPRGQSNMDNTEKLATQDTQDEEKQNKNKTQYVLDTTILTQIQKPRIIFFKHFFLSP